VIEFTILFLIDEKGIFCQLLNERINLHLSTRGAIFGHTHLFIDYVILLTHFCFIFAATLAKA